MTFNDDQMRAYIEQTAWAVGDKIYERLEKRMDEKIETHSLKCAKEQPSQGPSAVKQLSYAGGISSVIIAIVEVVKAYFSSKGS